MPAPLVVSAKPPPIVPFSVSVSAALSSYLAVGPERDWAGYRIAALNVFQGGVAVCPLPFNVIDTLGWRCRFELKRGPAVDRGSNAARQAQRREFVAVTVPSVMFRAPNSMLAPASTSVPLPHVVRS